jgi:hypothetical protein
MYSYYDAAHGTGGALSAALRLCQEDRVLVVNGDILLGAPVARLAAEAPYDDLVLTVRAVGDRSVAVSAACVSWATAFWVSQRRAKAAPDRSKRGSM